MNASPLRPGGVDMHVIRERLGPRRLRGQRGHDRPSDAAFVLTEPQRAQRDDWHGEARGKGSNETGTTTGMGEAPGKGSIETGATACMGEAPV